MIIVNIDPIIFQIGPLAVRWYGFMYFVGITAGLLVVRPYARLKGITWDILERIVPWAALAGLIGARLYFVVQQPLGPYLAQPWRILAFWEGGMAFYGAIFAVFLVLWIAARQLKISMLQLLDVAAIFGAVGQFFGRIGNIINGDILGYPTNLPWGFVYAHPNSFAPRHDIAYQPAAVYEALLNIALFGLVWALRNKFKPGVLFFVYVVAYSVSQIFVFFFRDNEVVLLGLKQAQLTAIVVIIAAVIIFFAVSAWQKRIGANTNRETRNPE